MVAAETFISAEMNYVVIASLALVVATFAVTTSDARVAPDSSVSETFTNPILDGDAADPAMIRIGEKYYLTFTGSGWNHITIYESPVMTEFRNRTSKRLFTAPPGFVDVWAPEFHLIDGELFIYFTMAGAAYDHHLYVMQAEDPNNPMGNWSEPFQYVRIFTLIKSLLLLLYSTEISQGSHLMTGLTPLF